MNQPNISDADGRNPTGGLALIPIRKGSKGLPGKNIRALAGKPLYLHTVEQALRVAGRCVISTDIPEVLAEGHPEGCVVLERPGALAGDSTPIDAVIAHALDSLAEDPGWVILLQATSPLRHDDDIRTGVDLFRTGEFELVMSVTAAEASVLKWGRLEGGRYLPLARPEYCFTNRQDLPPVYRPNGAVYVFSTAAFRRNGGLASAKLGAFEMPADRSADIDTLPDFLGVEASVLDALDAPRSRGR